MANLGYREKNICRLRFSVTTLILVVGCSPVLNAETLGRLFTTPAQRAYIDQFKSRYIKGEKIQPVLHSAPNAKKSKPSVEMPVTYNGLVKRSNGKNVVWVNGVLVDSEQSQKDEHQVKVLGEVSRDNSVVVKPVGTSRLVRLKPGQQWIPGNRVATDPLQSKKRIHKEKSKHIIRLERHK